MTEYQYIEDFTRNCKQLSDEIITRLCKRAIKNMNKIEATTAGSTDDYPVNFKFFDILCIELQSKYYDEINPFLEDFVEDSLMYEYEKLPSTERLIVDYSDYSDYYEYDPSIARNAILSKFNELWNEHYSTQKIQKFIETI